MNEKVVDWEGNEERKGCKREKNQLENLLEEFLWYSPTSTDDGRKLSTAQEYRFSWHAAFIFAGSSSLIQSCLRGVTFDTMIGS